VRTSARTDERLVGGSTSPIEQAGTTSGTLATQSIARDRENDMGTAPSRKVIAAGMIGNGVVIDVHQVALPSGATAPFAKAA
jgi:hypothetical protein